MPYKELAELKEVGDSPTGTVSEQDVMIEFEGESIKSRRIVVSLNKPTRDGETFVAVLKNLNSSDVCGIIISQTYLKHWTLEGLFQVFRDTLKY